MLVSLCRDAVRGGGAEREHWRFLHSAGLQSLPLLPTIKVGPSGAGSRVGGLVHTLGFCVSLQRTLLWGWEFLLLPPQPPLVPSIRGSRPYLPELEPWVVLSALIPHHSSRFIYARMWGLPAAAWPAPFHKSPPRWVLQTPPCRESCLPRLPISTPPTGLDECFFFISLVVILPYSLIFYQFWLFFVFKLLSSFFWLCKEAKCVYLRLHLDWKPSIGIFAGINVICGTLMWSFIDRNYKEC